MNSEIQDAVALAQDLREYRPVDVQLTTAISYTETELKYVQQLLKHRGGKDQRLITDELEVLARLADLKIQAGVE